MRDAQPQTSGEGRIARSWRLSRAALRVVRSDRGLLILATLSALFSAVGIAAIFVLSGLFTHRHGGDGRVAVAALILGYPITFVGVFFNTAIAAAASAALDGRHLSLSEALAVPMRRIGQVALWALIAAVVGVVLEQLASRLPLVGSIATRLVGLGWSLASLFAIPVLALEDRSAPDALRRSAALVKERWGEGIGGNLIVTAWMLLALIPTLIVFAIAIAATSSVPALQGVVIGLAVLAFIALLAMSAVVRQTFVVALYRYATADAVPGPFQARDLQAPFGRKRRFFG
jgi:Family of unknown function (DUF6159)